MGHELLPHNKFCATDDWLIKKIKKNNN